MNSGNFHLVILKLEAYLFLKRLYYWRSCFSGDWVSNAWFNTWFFTNCKFIAISFLMSNFLRVPFFSSNGAYWRKPHKYSTCILHWKNVRLLKKFMKSKNRCVYYLDVSLIYKYVFCHFLCCRVVALFEIHYIKTRNSVYHHFWGLC